MADEEEYIPSRAEQEALGNIPLPPRKRTRRANVNRISYGDAEIEEMAIERFPDYLFYGSKEKSQGWMCEGGRAGSKIFEGQSRQFVVEFKSKDKLEKEDVHNLIPLTHKNPELVAIAGGPAAAINDCRNILFYNVSLHFVNETGFAEAIALRDIEKGEPLYGWFSGDYFAKMGIKFPYMQLTVKPVPINDIMDPKIFIPSVVEQWNSEGGKHVELDTNKLPKHVQFKKEHLEISWESCSWDEMYKIYLAWFRKKSACKDIIVIDYRNMHERCSKEYYQSKWQRPEQGKAILMVIEMNLEQEKLICGMTRALTRSPDKQIFQDLRAREWYPAEKAQPTPRGKPSKPPKFDRKKKQPTAIDGMIFKTLLIFPKKR